VENWGGGPEMNVKPLAGRRTHERPRAQDRGFATGKDAIARVQGTQTAPQVNSVYRGKGRERNKKRDMLLHLGAG